MFRRMHVVWAVLSICILFVPGVAQTATLTVDTADGGKIGGNGDCSLREAMENVFHQAQTNVDCATAAPNGDIDIIVFAGVSSITIDGSGALTFDGELIIEGPITIDGGGATDQIISMDTSGRDLTLNGVTLQNAGASAILIGFDSNLTANGSEFSGNSATNGGAINATGTGTIRLNGCSFLNNDATGNGGAIAKGTGTELFATATAFIGNSADRGGAIYIFGTDTAEAVILDLDTFQTNSSDGIDAADGGGAIYVAGGGANSVISIVGCLFGGPGLGNTAERRGGAIYTQATAGFFNTDLTDFLSGGIVACDFTGNSTNGPNDDTGLGGAIYNQGILHVLNSVFDGNSAPTGNGGAIGDNQMISGRNLVVANTTFNGNSTGNNGGAIAMFHNAGNLELYNVTLSGNTAGGTGREIYANASSDVALANTIIANSSAGANCSATGIYADNGGNLLFDGGATASCGLSAGADPLLGSLTLNPGPLIMVRTMDLGGGSPALGTGSPATCGAWPVLSIDGRGMLRPAACDIGAFEGGGAGRLVINEVDYDQGATDDHEFIEIFNAGTEAVGLDNVKVQLIDGAGHGAVDYSSGGIDLPAVSLPPGGFYVICGQTGVNLPPVNCDLDITPNADLIQDGDTSGSDNPDAVALRVSGVLMDVVSYEGNTAAPFVESSGVGLEDIPSQPFFSISRAIDGVDSNINNEDFVGRCNSPGLTNLTDVGTSDCSVVPVELESFVVE